MQSWLIGGSKECDVVIDDPVVSGKHCRLNKQPNGYTLVDLGSTNGTYVNGRRLEAETRVSPEDTITLGSKLVLTWPDAGNAIGTPSVSRVITVGGAPDNMVVIERPMVSGHHARVLISDQGIIIEDLKSTNGTFVGSRDRRIAKERVSADDKIFLGSHEIFVRDLLSAAKVKPTGQVAPKAPRASTAAKPPTHQNPASKNPASMQAAGSTARSDSRLVIGIAAGLLVVLLLGGAAVMWPGGSKAGNDPAKALAGATVGAAGDAETSGLRPDGETASRSGTGDRFVMGNLESEGSINTIRVTIGIGADGDGVEGPLDLDMGLGFQLRLGVGEIVAAEKVAMAQKTSLVGTPETLAAGSEVWFEFSSTAEQDQNGRYSATPQFMADLTVGKISTLRLIDSGQSDWMLTNYTIEINGQPYASHSGVNWKPKDQSSLDQAELKKYEQAAQTLDEEISTVKSYIDQGLGEDSDKRELEAKEQERTRVGQALITLRARIKDPKSIYVERDAAAAWLKRLNRS